MNRSSENNNSMSEEKKKLKGVDSCEHIKHIIYLFIYFFFIKIL